MTSALLLLGTPKGGRGDRAARSLAADGAREHAPRERISTAGSVDACRGADMRFSE